MSPEKLQKNFERCADWEERYMYLIELGDRLEPFPVTKMNKTHLIAGCQSNVWLDLSISQQNKMSIQATSDSSLVKGLLALVLIAYNNQKPESILQFDIKGWFRQLDLKSQLSPSRSQGLEAIIKHILCHARAV
ncbi:SufE family protein [Vibrio syngnathi]|uniref:Cysteine desulfuration protein SufE n=1 Tax=Vibrio syngnathi TaxID=3034029 RepID=A0AA34TPD2_9VIBR|nr:SufE family protein [Vibrio syngnathi]ARP38544.1 Cysteine desulfuration protein SufE [Vibrio syngnathi]